MAVITLKKHRGQPSWSALPLSVNDGRTGKGRLRLKQAGAAGEPLLAAFAWNRSARQPAIVRAYGTCYRARTLIETEQPEWS